MTKSFVSQRLEEIRRKAGLTKVAMAERLGISYSTYTYYEYKFKDPHLPVALAEKIAEALAVCAFFGVA